MRTGSHLHCPFSKLRGIEKGKRFLRHRHTVVGTITIISAFLTLLSFRLGYRARLSKELAAAIKR
jgi:hypothetical protein